MASAISVPDARTRGRRVARLLDGPLTSYYLLLGATLLLTALGLVMVLSASSVIAFKAYGDSYYFVEKQAVGVGIGLVAFLVAARLPARIHRALAYPALLVTIGLLCLVLVPGVGVEVNANRNWLDLGGPFRLQPSEFAKIALVLWAADLLTRKRKLLGQLRHVLVPLAPVAAAVIGLVLLGDDLGTAVVLGAIVLAMLWFAGTPLRVFLLPLGATLAIAVSMIYAQPDRLERVQGYLDPLGRYWDSGWQASHGLFGLGTGGLVGVGLGASREKWGDLPAAHTDFIFAVIGEELGLLGTLVVLGLYSAAGYAGFRVAIRTKDGFVRLAAAGATGWLLIQASINIGAVLGLLPVTGIPLPLLSYGGSALIPTLFSLGMLVSFARTEPGAKAALANRSRRWPFGRLRSRTADVAQRGGG